MLRWQLEVTFQEVRAHLGVETQRQWSDRAIARTTPILMGLFSWTTLAAHLIAGTTAHEPSHRGLVRQAVADLRRCHRSGAPPLVAGVRGFFTVRTQNRIYGKSRLPCTTDLWIHSPTRLEMCKA